MTRTTRWQAAAVALLAVVLAACGAAQMPQGGVKPTPTPTPSTITYDEKEFTIVTPRGWAREVITRDADARKAIRYRASDGRYFVVALDPKGSGVGGDAVWRYAVTGKGFEVSSKEDCKATDGSCNITDTRYDVTVLWKLGAAPPKVAGHTWYFLLGDSSKRTIEAGLFEEILESIRVKA